MLPFDVIAFAWSEATTAWGTVVTGLQQRGLTAPFLLVVDGNGGLKNALKQWEGVRIQRCTTHKLENLKAHCPQHARAEMKRVRLYCVDAKGGLAIISPRAAENGSPCELRALRAG